MLKRDYNRRYAVMKINLADTVMLNFVGYKNFCKEKSNVFEYFKI